MLTKIACLFLCHYLAAVATAAGFAADPSINVSAIYAASQASAKASTGTIDSFPATSGDGNNVPIQGDWLNLDGVSAYHFTADMDVDCDGFQCSGNPDGQPETSFGALDATSVPWYVIPQTFWDAHQDIKPNALGAVICDGKMFYGIFGDTNGDDPQVIDEASLVLAQTCFPGEGLGGNKGHTPLDVLYIIFGSKVPSGVKKETIDIGALKTLGDEQVQLLAAALGGSGSANSTTTDL
ncbi:fungal chitosanase of glycosyl hydrolase group 75-domain-containing protein [Desarmillaria tabescens]|uniref:Endo-chitosanase n=1 Tax=Armillaria tabescens TaxID=1929756 RepID=A0AA39JRP4_ARMTA|nr:fungal chitosanase of glycosyl hydrolase group 75-domain-containing protein [Desarmillaria tabescens]KAK0445348.1 fungal chitosanase of glycosyl hydrolase group 75-domain-containing protein [Desarmillaria tabescens]